MSNQEFKRALDYANVAFDVLKRGAIPPYPKFYELLYTYATGVNATLNDRINAIFRRGDLPTPALAEELYDEFLKPAENERMTDASERMHLRIDVMQEAISSTMTAANAYSGSLQTASGDLERTSSGLQIKQIAEKLLHETRQMQETNHDLERKLEISRADIATLQQDLDDLRRQSLIDPLTKLANRKCFDDSLAKAVSQARKSDAPLCLMMLDIDHFKDFNDVYGHQTGDQVLKLVAIVLKSNIKGKDLAARYGGEEFAAIMPSTDLKGALKVAEDVRCAIQTKELLKLSTNQNLGRITASFGVTACRPDDSPATLIERADKFLYAAKRAGRNCIVCETDPEAIGPTGIASPAPAGLL